MGDDTTRESELGLAIRRRVMLGVLGLAGAGAAIGGLVACQGQPAPTATSAPTPLPPPSPASPAVPPAAKPSADVATRPAPTQPATAAPTTSVPATSAPTPSPEAKPAGVAAKVEGIADIAVVRGQNRADIVRTAIDAMGGIGRFVKPGQKVVVKPNICISSAPEYAATTNPEVVAAVVRLCKEAGAGSVKVLDYGFGGQRTSYQTSGIEDAIKLVGGEMVPITPVKWKPTPVPTGKRLKTVAIFDDVLTADVIISVPIAKHHNLARLTLGMKNMLGVIQAREQLHYELGQQLSDLLTVVKPSLTIIDAVRILTRNGPQGGNLADVKQLDTVIASTDIVAIDAFASTLFGLETDALATVRAGHENGLGQMDLSKLKVVQVSRQ